jgi:anti-repressor protein
MDSKIQIFENKEFGKLRTVENDGKVMFVASDVAKMLGYAKPADAIKVHCRYTVKHGIPHPQGNGTLGVNIIPEGDVYRLIIRSKLPSAQRFESWVFDNVLPAIRKNGMYMTQSVAQQAIDNPTEFLARAVLLANDQIKKLKLENDNLKPKAEFYDAVASTEDLTSIGDVAKLLDMGIGRNKLYAFLRSKGVLRSNNVPYQRYVDAGYFKLVESKVDRGETVMICTTTFVKQRGIDYIRKLLKEDSKVSKTA